MNWGTCTSCKFRFCTQCRDKWHPYTRCKDSFAFEEKKLKLTKEQEERAEEAKKEVKHVYDQIINERKNLFFMSKCTKPCPNTKCTF